MNVSATDPRWIKLFDRTWTCAGCGQAHQGVFDLACAKPEHWQGSEAPASNSLVSTATHFLSEDFCILDGEHFFVRCVLKMPLLGIADQAFGFGVWSTLSKKNFDLYVAAFDNGEQQHLGPWFGWFSNRLKPYPDTLNLKCQVQPQNGRQRPLIELEPSDHRLSQDARGGIDFDRLMEIYAANGHKLVV